MEIGRCRDRSSGEIMGGKSVALSADVFSSPDTEIGATLFSEGTPLPAMRTTTISRMDGEIEIEFSAQADDEPVLLTTLHVKELGPRQQRWMPLTLQVVIDEDGYLSAISASPRDVVLTRFHTSAPTTVSAKSRATARPGSTESAVASDLVESRVYASANGAKQEHASTLDSSRRELARYIFVSHATADAGAAMRLVEVIERRAGVCWIAPRDVRTGGDYRAEIVEAIKSCDAVVVLVSKASNASAHVLRELGLADKYGKTVKPVRMDSCDLRPELEYQLQGLHWLPFDDRMAFVGALLRD